MVSAQTRFLALVFYALKNVSSEIIETVIPSAIENSILLPFRLVLESLYA
jgi:hypothetical protein